MCQLSKEGLKLILFMALMYCSLKTVAQNSKAEKMNNSGIAFYEKKEYADAILDFSEAIRIDPKYTKAWVSRGNAYKILKKYDEAIVDYSQAILLEKSAQNLNIRAKVYELTNRNKLALADYVEAINTDPRYMASYSNRIHFYRKIGMYDKALEYAKDFIDANPSAGDAYYLRGRVYEESGKYSEAILDYSNAIRINPADINSIQQLGVCYKLKGVYPAAIEQFEKIVSIYPKWILGYLNLMSPMMRSRRFLKAKEYLDQLKRLDKEAFNNLLNQGNEYKYISRALFEDMPLNNYEDALLKMNIALEDFNRRVLNITSELKGNDLEIYTDILAFKGYLLEKINRNPEAIDTYNQTLLINPSQLEVIEAIKMLTQKQSIVNIQDKTMPTIELISPQATRGLKIVKNETNIEIVGKAKDESGIKSIKVNGIAIAKVEDDGLFITNVSLKEGLNKITVVATDKNNNTATRTFEINTTIQAIAVKKEDNQIIPVLADKPPVFYAILIAENDYQDPTIDDLSNPVKDALELKNTLKTKYTFEEKNIETLLNKSREEIMQAIVQKSNSLTNNDNLIIFYAGHGIAEKDKFGDVDGYWIPTSAKKGITSTYISSDDINKALKRSESKHILIIADACFSGAFTRAMDTSAPKEIQVQYNYASRKIMASGNMEPVPDNSKFIYYLNKNLKDNKLKYLTAKDLFNSFYKAVINNTDTLPQYAAIKNVGDEGGEFVFILK